MGTGAIWTRWCFIIKPRNLLYVALDLSPLMLPAVQPATSRIHILTWLTSLAAVNFFLGCVGFIQVTRIFLYRRSLEGSSAEAAKDIKHEITDSAKAVVSKS